MRTLPPERRGLGTGTWMASFFLGQFINPIVVLSLAGMFGGRPAAVHLIGLVLLVMTGIALVASLRSAKKLEHSGLIENG